MKKTSKRILSILMTLAMVVTMLPTFAMTANAAAASHGNGVMSEYLTDSNKTGFSGTATWDNTMKAWSFDGSKYLKLDDTPLNGVTTSSGFAVSFEVYNTNNALNNKYFNFYNGSSRYTMDGSSETWYVRYRTEISDGSNTRGYYTSDFTNADFCSKTHTANGNDSYPTNKWYTMTVVMNTDGSYSYYRNGDLLATFKSNYISTGNGGGLSDANAIAAVSDATNYVIGASDTNGTNGFTGYMRNFKVIKGITANSAGQLALLMTRYEAKMASGDVYTNMAAAYKAYVDANEAYDAVVYGNSNTAQVSAAYSALETAMGNMSPWDGYRGTYAPPKGTFNGDSQPATYYEGHYNNLLYMPTGQKARSGYNDQNFLRVYISTPSKVVALYDGVNIAKFPAMPIVQSNGNNKPRGLSCFYIGDNNKSNDESDRTQTNSYIYFDEPWHWGGSGDNYDFTWNEAQAGTEIPCTYSTASTSPSVSGGYSGLSGHICIKNDNISMSSSTTSMTLSGTVYFVGRNRDSGLHTYTSQNLNYITLINYKPVYDLINSSANKAKLADVESYKEGGLLPLLNAYTAAENFNPNNYDFSGSIPAQYGTDMAAVVSAFSSASTTTDNASQYIALRNAIDFSGSPSGLDDSSLDGKVYGVRELIQYNGMVDTNNDGVRDKVLTGYDLLLAKYNAAAGVMATLGTAEYNTNLTSNYTNGSGAATAATELSSAFDALSIVDLTKPTVTGQTYLGPSDVITVTDTNNGNATYSWEYSTNSGSTWTSGGSVASAGGTFAPFSVAACVNAVTVLIRVKAEIGTAFEYDVFGGVTHTYYVAPTADVASGDHIASNATVTLNNSASGLNGTLHYQISTDNGSTWSNDTTYSTPFVPFINSSTKVKIKAWEISSGGSKSAELIIDNVRMSTNVPVIYGTNGTDNDLVFLDNDDTIVITNNDPGASTVYDYSTNGGTNWTSDQDYSSAITPFSGQIASLASTFTIRARSTRHGTTSASSSDTTFRHITCPNIYKTGSGEITGAANNILTSSDTVTLVETNGFSSTYGQIQYRVEDLNNPGTYLNGGAWSNYYDSQSGGAFCPFTVGSPATTPTYVRIHARQYVSAGTISGEKTVDVKLKPAAPTVTPNGAYLDASHGITATTNEASCDTDATLMYCSTESGTYSPFSNIAPNGTYYPFKNETPSGTSMQFDLYVKAVRNGAESSVVHITYSSLGWPTIINGNTQYSPDLHANDELTDSDVLTLESSTGTSGGTLKYAFSVDGGSTWSDAKTYNGSITPFEETITFNNGATSVNLSNKVKFSIKTWEERDGSTSGENIIGPVLLKKTAPLSLYWQQDSETTPNPNPKLDSSYDENGHFFINTEGYEGCAIYYQASVDGSTPITFNSYNVNQGIDSDAYANNTVVTFNFFIIENNTKSVFATGTFYSGKNYKELAFHESFDGASVSGGTLTFSDNQGTATGTSGAFSIKNGAGYVDNNSNSPDWRENVLKINANSTAPGNSIQFTNNPLSSNAATATVANQRGVTISFWRYLERNGACTDLDASGDPTGYNWRNAIAFDDGDATNGQGYYLVEVNGTNSICKTQGTDYYDYVQENQDPTGHAAGNARGNWVNVVITINPNVDNSHFGVMLYTNGEPHNMKASYPKKGGTFTGKTEAQIAKEILSLITSGSTNMYFNYGDRMEGNDYDLYLDDIRIYSKVLTQTEINNMYIDENADVQTSESKLSSTSHDPTNVTVYTLAKAVPCNNGTKPIGAKVGQEFIDYYGLDPVVGHGDVSAIDEYSFGTGMTIYHRNKTNGKWEVVGDDYGHCGYQNEKLFGAEYHTALATPLAYAAGDSRTGAGHLVWAPHVMYNLTTDKWVYYGSTSSWGSSRSAVFMCQNDTNDDITGPYTYNSDVYRSTAHPNGIDACVYYSYISDGQGGYKPDPANLNMIFGSWGGTSAIAYKPLNTDGTTSNNTSYSSIICYGINGDLEGASDGGSGEGGYIVFENGYYYLYVSYGQNTGSYVERVYRSTSPNSGFVGYNSVSATDNSTQATHGSQILGPFDSSIYNYTFVSTGHNSVYKTVNNYGEVVSLNSTHARPLANDNHNWTALPDGALATRQSEVTGNTNLVNQIAYTESGWPVIMPYQYDGTDTVKATITADEFEGIYVANDMQNTEYYNWSNEYTYTIIKDDDDETNTGCYEYGTDDGGDVFKGYVKLTKGSDGTQYATWYTSKAKYTEWMAKTQSERDSIISEWASVQSSDKRNTTYCSYVEYEGVIGKHNGKVCISEICTYDAEHSWTFRTGDVPKPEDVDALGDSVSMDGVIYTHKANDNYAKYGCQISDDFQYGASDAHLGERYTTITMTYPAKIDVSNPTAIYCLSDEELCKTGQYSGGEYSVVALNDNKWYDDSGNKFTDEQAMDLDGVSDKDGSTLKRLYGLKGYVSDYYFNQSTGKYADSGVTLIVTYNDVNTGYQYSEFEFCYVMANPAMAHTILGIRNTNAGQTAVHPDQRAGHMLYDRFIGSYGTSTNIISNYVQHSKTTVGGSNTSEEHSVGTFKYLSDFGSAESIAYDYSSPAKVSNAFDAFGETVGHSSGSFGVIEHDDNPDPSNYDSRTVSSSVVDTDYYVDYSNDQDKLITRDGNGTPTGYKFTMRTTNIYWQDVRVDRWGATSYFLNRTGLNYDASYDSSRDKMSTAADENGRDTYGNAGSDSTSSTSASNISGLGKYSTNSKNEDINGHGTGSEDGYENRFSVGLSSTVGDIGPGRLVMSGYLSDPAGYLSSHNLASNVTPSDDAFKTATDYASDTLDRGFDYIDAGRTGTGNWDMHIDFTGKNSVPKNTDTSLPAEQYANFIIEQGINVKSWHTTPYFWTYRYAFPEETYAYYNIGVHTCDKGAARAFAENYLRKKLAVTIDPTTKVETVKVDANGAPIYLKEDGTETTNVDEAAILNPSHYTTASYNAYINAVAELSYFVENPTNTTFADYKPINSNASTEYSTAYTAGGAPIYNTTTSGNTIFKDGSTTNTDSVQAKLIQDVITAYENLYSIEEYTEEADTFCEIEITTTTTDNDTINVYPSVDEEGDPTGTPVVYNKANYTDASWAKFLEIVGKVGKEFKYDKDIKGSWRTITLPANDYRKITEVLSTFETEVLMPKVDVDGGADEVTISGVSSDITSTISTKTTLRNGGIYSDGNQVYTLGSWNDLNTEIGNANTIMNAKKNLARYNATAKSLTYGTEGSTTTINYNKPTVGSYTTDQQAVNTENATLSAKVLTAVDVATAYQTYDAAYAVANSVDRDKYTAAGLAQLQTALDTRDNVYAASDYNVSDYNSVMHTSLNPSSDKIKLTASGATDYETGQLLSALTVLNSDAQDTFVKKLRVTFTITKGSGESYPTQGTPVDTTVGYGEDYAFDASDYMEAGNSVNFSITKYADADFSDPTKAKGSTKVSTNSGSITQVVNTPMAVVAKINTGGATSNVKVTIKDIYGKLVDVFYVASGYPQINGSGNLVINSNGDVYAAPAVAFYDFVKWNKVAQSEGAVTYRPEYAVKGEMCAFSYDSDIATLTNTKGGTVERAQRDAKLTLSYETENKVVDGTFHAWASIPKKSECDGDKGNKYQIISYNPTYWFYATTDEDFYPIIKKSDNKYYVYSDGETEALTPSMIDSFTYLDYSGVDTSEEKDQIDKDILYAKLNQRAPFISISFEEVTEDNTKYRFTSTMRMTYYDGDDADEKNDLNATITTLYTKKAIYVQSPERERTFIKGATGVTPISITNILDNGQFEVTARYPVTTSGNALIRACMEYPLNYDGSTVTLCDYSTISPLNFDEL